MLDTRDRSHDSIQPRWAGRVLRMPNNRPPKTIFYSQQAQGNRASGHPVKRYKDNLKLALKECSIVPNSWETAALNRTFWRKMCHEGVENFEEDRIRAAVRKRPKRKTGLSASGTLICTRCGRHWPLALPKLVSSLIMRKHEL